MFWIALSFVFVSIVISITIIAWKCVEEGYKGGIPMLEKRVKALEDMMKGEG